MPPRCRLSRRGSNPSSAIRPGSVKSFGSWSKTVAWRNVFASEVGTPLAVRNIIRRGLEPALAAAELPKLTWHDLRHLAASLLIAEGASVGYVSRILGHATPAITLSLYAHEFAKAEHDDHTREQMEAAFGNLL
jgi:integrase